MRTQLSCLGCLRSALTIGLQLVGFLAFPVSAQRALVLRRVPLRAGLATAVYNQPLGLAVSSNGRVAMVSDVAMGKHEGKLLQILSPTADTMISVGRRGNGPGELSGGPDIPFASGDTFNVYVPARLTVVMYSDAGRYLGERRLEGSGSTIPLAMRGDSIDYLELKPSRQLVAAPPPMRGKIGGREGRPLLSGSDTMFRRLQVQRGAGGNFEQLRPFAFTKSLTAVADPIAYRVGIYTADGKALYYLRRDLAPKRRTPAEVSELRKSLQSLLDGDKRNTDLSRKLRTRLDTLEREAIAHFDRSGLGFDAKGRLWVIGEIGEKTFADVFDAGRFLGRQLLPCAHPARRIALQGRWLALDCETPGRVEAPFELQLYAIPDR